MARRRHVNTTKAEIIQVGIHLMLEKGFTATTIKEISEILGISKGNITFYFPTKEHLLLELTKEILDFHMKCIETVQQSGYSNLFAYCWEVVAQIGVCEDDEKMRDLYLAVYSHPRTVAMVKEWTANKNYILLKDRMPDWTQERFRLVENVACCIERSALTEPCTESYTFKKKVLLTVDSLLRLYDVEKKEREEVFVQIMQMDYHEIGKVLHRRFAEYTEKTNEKMLNNTLRNNNILLDKEEET